MLFLNSNQGKSYAEENEETVERKQKRRRSKKIILVILLLLLIILLSYFMYYLQKREIPLPTVEFAKTQVITPPKFVFFFDGSPKNKLSKPIGVRVHPTTNEIFVADTGNHRVSVFDEKGIFLFSFNKIGAEGTMRTPLYLAFDPKGNIWVTDRSRESLYVFTKDGSFIKKFIPNDDESYNWQPIALHFDKKGNLYVTDMQIDHQLLVFDPKGKLLRKIGTKGEADNMLQLPGQFSFPNGVSVYEANEDIFVADSNNRRLQVFDKNGKFKSIIQTGGLPRGMEIGFKDRIHAVDVMAHNVMVFSTKGVPLVTFGELGIDTAQFFFPTGIDCDGRFIYVTDTQNDRVQVWAWQPTVPVPDIKTGIDIMKRWSWLPLLLLPLIYWILKRRRFVAAESFLLRIIEDKKLKLLERKFKHIYVTPDVFEKFKEYAERGLAMKDVMIKGEFDEDVAEKFKEDYGLSIDEARTLAITRKGGAKPMLFVEDSRLREAAYEVGLKTMTFDEFIEKYERKA